MLRQFANSINMEFDIEQLDIAMLTSRRRNNPKPETDVELFRDKRDYIHKMIEYLQLTSFFSDQDMKKINESNEVAGS